MEQNIPVIARRAWDIVRVLFSMVRKGILKRKLLVDLNILMKRGRIAGKAIGNLMLHHHASTTNRRSHGGHLSFATPSEYEFSCDNSPAYPSLPFSFGKRRNNHHSYHFFPCTHAPATDDEEWTSVNTVKRALEMLNGQVTASSPILPGFGRSPFVRQLRITDSPFPLSNVDEDSHVDEAAEEFIKKFYDDLKNQKIMASLECCEYQLL